jgi:hypothetical protein
VQWRACSFAELPFLHSPYEQFDFGLAGQWRACPVAGERKLSRASPARRKGSAHSAARAAPFAELAFLHSALAGSSIWLAVSGEPAVRRAGFSSFCLCGQLEFGWRPQWRACPFADERKLSCESPARSKGWAHSVAGAAPFAELPFSSFCPCGQFDFRLAVNGQPDRSPMANGRMLMGGSPSTT